MPEANGIRSRVIESVNGLNLEIWEAGTPDNPCVVLLHGYPDLAYGWRFVMPELAQQGYYVIAPNQRGYGQTTGWQTGFDVDLRAFGMQNLVKDLAALLFKLKIKSVHCLVGHDFGSPVAAYFSLFREDLVHRLVLMSAPFPGAPQPDAGVLDLDPGLSELSPARQHYQAYHSSSTANADMLSCEEGIEDFLHAYYHMKSADWRANSPFPLTSWSAEQLAQMPAYYIMPYGRTMPEVVAEHKPEDFASWLSSDDLKVYADAFIKTGFQGALNWYRASSDPSIRSELGLLFNKTINTPTWYLTGAKDWGTYQTPGALGRMETRVCSDFRGSIYIADAGHWVQQEQAALTTTHLIDICAAEVP